MTDKELDQLIKSKLAGKTYPYNPANWKAMEAMLDQAQASSAPYFWRQTAAILLLTLLLGIPLLWQNTGTKTAPEAPAQEQISSQSETILPEKAQKPESISETETVEPVAVQSNKGATNATNIQASSIKESNSLTSQGANPSTALAAAGGGSGNASLTSPLAQANSPQRKQAEYLVVSDKETQYVLSDYALNAGLMPLAAASPSAPKPIIDPRALAKFDNRHEFSIQAGPSINQAYNNQTGTGWQAGLHYRYRAFSNLAFSTSVNYVRTGDMGIATVADSVFFGFGRTEVHTEKHYRQISSVRIPLKAEYNLSPKHIITGGAYADVVTAVQMDMHKTTRQYKADPKVEEHSSNQPRNEFSNVNYGATFGYFYRYDPRLSLGINLNYSLTDLTNDQYQKFEGDHRLLQSELVIRYRLF